MSDDARDLRERWETRARDKGETLAGVLYRGLPEVLNRHIGRWHEAVIAERVLPLVPAGGRVLDLGCGYGRIAAAVRRARPDVEVVGADFAHGYCRMFAERIAQPAVCADLRAPPFAPGSFDGLLAVTSLMYAPAGDLDALVARLLGLLRPGGPALFVDPGREFTSLVALLRPGSRTTPTGGHWFTRAEYDGLGDRCPARVAARGGVGVFSLLLPLLVPLARAGLAGKRLLGAVAAVDRRAPFLRRFSIHRWMLLVRD